MAKIYVKYNLNIVIIQADLLRAHQRGRMSSLHTQITIFYIDD